MNGLIFSLQAQKHRNIHSFYLIPLAERKFFSQGCFRTHESACKPKYCSITAMFSDKNYQDFQQLILYLLLCLGCEQC